MLLSKMVNILKRVSFCAPKVKLKYKTTLIAVFLWIIIIIFTNQKLNKINGSGQTLHEKTFLGIMYSRTTLVSHICNSIFPTRKTSYLRTSNLYWLRKENVAYCPIFKSATSTWRNHLVDLLNFSRSIDMNAAVYKDNRIPVGVHENLMQLGAIKPKSKEFMIYVNSLPEKNNFTGFMVVRHPFNRLVSAFRDKLERNLEEPFYYDNFGKHFVEKYREKALKELGEDFFGKENNFGTPMKVLNNGRPNADLPSFWEFVQAIIDRYKMDEHWIPIYQFCSVCNPTAMKAFQYILKFEELETEEKMFLNNFDWKIEENNLKKLNANHPYNMPNDQLTQLYFSILSKEQIMGLYKVYELDFLLFNYTFIFGDLYLPNSQWNMNYHN